MAVAIQQKKMYFALFLRKHKLAYWCEQISTGRWKNNEVVISIACISKGQSVQAAEDGKTMQKNMKYHTAYHMMVGSNV